MLDAFFLTVNQWMTTETSLALLGCFLWGVISVLFSPCHLASIPLVVSYVAGQKGVMRVGQAAQYAGCFTAGLFVTIALVGIVCALLGRMLGEIGPYWTILVGAVLIWVALDMIGVSACSISGGSLQRFNLSGRFGAFGLGLLYGLLSGSCTFGFIAPMLAFITLQQEIARGVLYIVLFGIGHCIPIVIAGSSMAMVKGLLETTRFKWGRRWFGRLGGVAIGIFGVYFIMRPFWET